MNKICGRLGFQEVPNVGVTVDVTDAFSQGDRWTATVVYGYVSDHGMVDLSIGRIRSCYNREKAIDGLR